MSFFHRRLIGLTGLLLLLGLLPVARGEQRSATSPEMNQTVFLPIVRTNIPLRRSFFGAEIGPGGVQATITSGVASRFSWVRYNGIMWSAVEPIKGRRNWNVLAGFEAEIEAINAGGNRAMVVIRSTPAWAQQVAGSSCGPIKPGELDAFASFVHDVVARYSRPPYNVQAWEMWNEPDVDPSLVSRDSAFGCWGNQSDTFYGGEYFGEMLKRVYPAIKQADPQSQVVLGGLLLACPNENGAKGSIMPNDCQPGAFLEGVLRNGGDKAFDIAAFHAYTSGNVVDRDDDWRDGTWKALGGGRLLGKARYVKEVMARHQATQPVMMNEGGVLCNNAPVFNCPSRAFMLAQAMHGVRFFTRAATAGLAGLIWYTLDGPGWRDGALLDAAQKPRPVYTSLTFMADLLQDAQYMGPLAAPPGTMAKYEGYLFQKGASTYQIWWTNEGSPFSVPITTHGLNAVVYDGFGNSVAVNPATTLVSFKPIVIAIQP
ncbi:MAG: hypothetical protein NVSMB42_12040 [Herpetosiphon sp.]